MSDFKFRNGQFIPEGFSTSVLGTGPRLMVDVSESNISIEEKLHQSEIAEKFLDFVNTTYGTNYQGAIVLGVCEANNLKATVLDIQLQNVKL